jgi:hypothetical protein
LPKKSSQTPSPSLRRLVWQHADGLTFLQRLDQQTNAGQIGRRQMQVLTLAAHQISLPNGGLTSAVDKAP